MENIKSHFELFYLLSTTLKMIIDAWDKSYPITGNPPKYFFKITLMTISLHMSIIHVHVFIILHFWKRQTVWKSYLGLTEAQTIGAELAIPHANTCTLNQK